MVNKEWDAQSYNENSALQYKASKKFFNDLPLKGDEIILDIGCGTGLLTSEMAQRAPQGEVIGIDSSESMIVFANEHHSQPNLKFVLMRAEELNFSFNFDVIISSFCIHWIKDKQAFFHKIAAQLKQNGSISFIMPIRHRGIAKIRHQLMMESYWSQYFDRGDAQEVLVFEEKYHEYAEEAGLDNLIYQTEDVITNFESSAKLKAFLKNIDSYLDRIPTEELRDKFMQEVVDLYLQENPCAIDGSCAVTYTYGKIRSQGIKNRVTHVGEKDAISYSAC